MIKFGTTKYISKEERASAEMKLETDKYMMRCNWHKFFAIFPRHIVEGDVSYFAVGSMYRRGMEEYSWHSEDCTYYKWVWEYASEFSSETRVATDPRKQIRGKRMV